MLLHHRLFLQQQFNAYLHHTISTFPIQTPRVPSTYTDDKIVVPPFHSCITPVHDAVLKNDSIQPHGLTEHEKVMDVSQWTRTRINRSKGTRNGNEVDEDFGGSTNDEQRDMFLETRIINMLIASR